MSYKFKQLSPEEFTVDDYRIYKDSNGCWISSPSIESVELQKAVNNYINAKEGNLPASEKTSEFSCNRVFRKLRARTGTL